MVIPSVPSPVVLKMDTVRVLPAPDTFTCPEAVPVAFRMTVAALRVLEPKFPPVYVTV